MMLPVAGAPAPVPRFHRGDVYARGIWQCNRLYLGRIISKPRRLRDGGQRAADSARVKYAFASRDNASRTLNSQSR